MAKPTEEESQEFLLSCRYGELDEVKEFVEKFGAEVVSDIRDDRGNSALHMICGNGHLDVLEYLLPHASKSLLSATNSNGSPAIHWAVFNNHVGCVKALAELPEEQGGGLQLVKQKNRAGRDTFDEALFAGEGKEEVAGWIEGFLFKLEGDGEEDVPEAETADAEVEKVHEGDEVKDEDIVEEIAKKTEEVDLKASS